MDVSWNILLARDAFQPRPTVTSLSFNQDGTQIAVSTDNLAVGGDWKHDKDQGQDFQWRRWLRSIRLQQSIRLWGATPPPQP